MSGWWQVQVYDDHDTVVGTVWFDRRVGGWSYRCKLTHGRSRACLRTVEAFLGADEALKALGEHQERELERVAAVRGFMRAANQ